MRDNASGHRSSPMLNVREGVESDRNAVCNSALGVDSARAYERTDTLGLTL